jgi:hypothetical protein
VSSGVVNTAIMVLAVVIMMDSGCMEEQGEATHDSTAQRSRNRDMQVQVISTSSGAQVCRSQQPTVSRFPWRMRRTSRHHHQRHYHPS